MSTLETLLGRVRGAEYTADSWCDACTAADTLGEMTR